MISKLTGRTRTIQRRRLFRKALPILQVEVQCQGLTYKYSHINSDQLETVPYDYTYWRDA